MRPANGTRVIEPEVVMLSELGLVYCGPYNDDEEVSSPSTTKKVKTAPKKGKKPASKAKAK